MISVCGYPFPTSDNRAIRNGARSFQRYKSKEYVEFLKEVQIWKLKNSNLVRDGRAFMQANREAPLDISIRLVMKPSKIIRPMGG